MIAEVPVELTDEREMSDPSRAPGARQVLLYFAIILIGPMLLLALWTGFKFELENRLSARNAAGYPGLMDEQAPDLLFIGSSHTRQSYDISAIEAATGKKAYILSYGSLDMNFMDLLLREVIPDAAHRPKILVLEAYPGIFGRKPDIGDPRIFFDGPPAFKVNVIRNYLHFHPGVSSWFDIFDLVVNRGSDQIATYPLNSRILANLSYKGAYRGKTVPGLTPEVFQNLHAKMASGTPHPDQYAALLDIIELCRRYSVKLILADAPLPKPVSADPEIQSLKSDFRHVAAQYNLPYLDGDIGFPTNDPTLFADEVHLSTAGRTIYTQQSIQRLEPFLIQLQQSPANISDGQIQIEPRTKPDGGSK